VPSRGWSAQRASALPRWLLFYIHYPCANRYRMEGELYGLRVTVVLSAEIRYRRRGTRENRIQSRRPEEQNFICFPQIIQLSLCKLFDTVKIEALNEK